MREVTIKVIFISQCSKNGLIETRRIIDQFAERKGDAVWETNITQQGLDTVKRLLKATARRNTAVACHLLRGQLQTELLWIVGNAKKFNREGIVPTNITERDVLRTCDENNWNTGEAIAILASIAGMFHDFGKANSLFQDKLKGTSKKNYEPFRHEWISLILFKRFVGQLSDREWLKKLSQIAQKDDNELIRDFPETYIELKKNPLKDLPKLAKFIGWLILSHHKLPVSAAGQLNAEPTLDRIGGWIDGKQFSALWNSPQCDKDKNNADSIKKVGTFKLGTPFQSKIWCKKANKLAARALSYFGLLDLDWFKDRFSMHLIRASLMLSDHLYSDKNPDTKYQDPSYMAYANTFQKKVLKQKLDEHNIGVARDASTIARMLPKLYETLPPVSYQKSKGFKKRSNEKDFAWQNEAYDLAFSLKERSQDCGFFGVNLASTGCGKTLANAKIMYGISDKAKGCRFSIALGLRMLTLQTGDALKNRLQLENDDLAVMIGSQAFQELYENKNLQEQEVESGNSLMGSESLDDFEDDQDYVAYGGSLDNGILSQILKSKPNLQKMICAPILVSTIDYLISATESKKGGKQIGPILRLLTSDLVLDEPDDFDVADLPALCRLVNFAGVFGSRVLLSSATLPPAIVKALFDAYSAGRKEFNKACRKEFVRPEVCCAWFDEFGVYSDNHEAIDAFMSSHQKFIKTRLANLDKQQILRRARLVPVNTSSNGDVIFEMTNSIHDSIYKLHDLHQQINPKTGKRISIGIIRMANINPMVAVAKEILSREALKGYCIHFCVYHSRFTMIVRSKIEEVLDRVLSRHNPDLIWEIPEVQSALLKNESSNHIFIVFATSVAEVGRDHDYDWAIVEPSSMRSIIQLAGRVQRHRKIPPSHYNLLILNKNIRGLKGAEVAFHKPGFESNTYRMDSKDLSLTLLSHQFENITAKPRLAESFDMNYRKNLVDLEHVRLKAMLFGDGKDPFYASLWWQSNADWCGELQRRSPFRKSTGIDKDYIAYLQESGDKPEMSEWPKGGELIKVENRDFEADHFQPSQNNYLWIECDVGSEIEKRSLKSKLSLRDASLKFARISLKILGDGERWFMNPFFGFYQK